MEFLVFFLVSAALIGLVVGGLARFAVPGPDPMPWWLTIAFGVVGSLLGGILGQALGGGVLGWLIGSVIVATLLVIGYRRFVQKRGITGPDSKRRPTRGLGVGARTDGEAMQQLERLGELRASGVISQEEFDAKKAELLRRV